jgi:hypothetical protein
LITIPGELCPAPKKREEKGNEEEVLTMRPAKLETKRMHVVTMPQETTILEIHFDGVAFFSIRLLGISKIT